jgi:hypothetical protein
MTAKSLARWTGGLSGLLAVALGVRLFVGASWHHVTLGRDTTRITAPLRADGSVDYVAAVNAQYGGGVRPEENAAVALFAAFGPGTMAGPRGAALVALMGAGPMAEPAHPMVHFTKFVETRLGRELERAEEREWDEVETRARSTPWAAAELPELAAWLKDAGPTLDAVVAAAGRPKYYVPCITNPGETLFQAFVPSLGTFRMAASALAVRAMLRVGAGRTVSDADLAAAWGDLVAVHRLGRLQLQAPSMIERLVGIAIVSLADKAVAGVLAHCALTPRQAALLRHDLEALPPPAGFVECVDVYDRYAVLDILFTMALYGGDPDGPGLGSGRARGTPTVGPMSFGLLPIHFDEAMRQANAWTDRTVAAASIPDFAAREAALRAVDADAGAAAAAAGRSFSKQKKLEALAIGWSSDRGQPFRQHAQVEQEADHVLAGLKAVERFAGTSPADVDVQSWAGGLPVDRFTGQPIAVEVIASGLRFTSPGPPAVGTRKPRPIAVDVLLR